MGYSPCTQNVELYPYSSVGNGKNQYTQQGNFFSGKNKPLCCSVTSPIPTSTKKANYQAQVGLVYCPDATAVN